MIERTLVVIKPDGVQRCLVGEILGRFEKAGLRIVGMRMIWADKDFAAKHYDAHSDKPFFGELVEFISEGPVVAFVLEGVHAVENVRRLVGTTSPHESAPGTIRGDYAHMSMKYASETKKGGKNLIHASGNLEEAKQEVALWFTDEELHSYETVHDKHVM